MLYTNGGITNAGFAIVNLIREYCDKFNIIVPFKCHSTGTLIALGADEILMSKVGQLSPIDPSTFHALGPKDQTSGIIQPISINVEDIMGYFELAKDDAKIDSNNMIEAFKILATNIHPAVLGAIKRAELQVSYMANTLLRFHCTDDTKNSKIVNELLKERFSHQYLITRREAKDIGLPIGDISDIESSVMGLYKQYEGLLGLQSNFNPNQILGNAIQKSLDVNQAILENAEMTHTHRTSVELTEMKIAVPSPPGSISQPNIIQRQIQESRTPLGWMQD